MATKITITCDHCGELAHYATRLAVKTAVYDDGISSKYKTQELDLCENCASQALTAIINAQDETEGREFLKRWGKGLSKSTTPG